MSIQNHLIEILGRDDRRRLLAICEPVGLVLGQVVCEPAMTQLAGHFLVDAAGKVAWTQIEAPDGPHSIGIFPTPAELIAAAKRLGR